MIFIIIIIVINSDGESHSPDSNLLKMAVSRSSTTEAEAYHFRNHAMIPTFSASGSTDEVMDAPASHDDESSNLLKKKTV